MKRPTGSPGAKIVFGTYGPPLLKRRLALLAVLLRTHFHIIGKSGYGKSRFLALLYLSLIRAGYSATLFDPHGDLAELVLAYLVATNAYKDGKGFDRLLYLDLAAAERAGRFLPLNILHQPHARPDAIASNIKEVFHRAWPELAQGAATFDTLLPDAVLLLLHNNLPLTSMHRLLVDDDFRATLLDREADADLIASFAHLYNRLRKPDQVAYAGSVLRRARQLTQIDILRYGLGQTDLLLDWRRIIDGGTSVIINLGGINPDARRLLGCIFTVGAEQGALSRADIPAAQRSGTHFLVIDEFSEFVAQSEEALARMLSLTRKYGLFAIMAHQGWSQASARLRGALGIVGVRVTFKLDRDDAAYSARILGRVDPRTVRHTVTVDASESVGMAEAWERWTQAIEDLAPRQAFVKLPTGAVVKIDTLAVPDPTVDPAQLQAVKDHYLQTCFRPREEIAQALDERRREAAVPRRRLARVETVEDDP